MPQIHGDRQLDEMIPAGQRIAIIGSGISGLGAAMSLWDRHQVTVYEKRSRLGGHAATVDVNYDGTVIPVDTGFIVYNERNYPNLTALFRHFNIGTERSSMSFAVSLFESDFEWGNSALSALYARRRNMFSPGFHWMFLEILRFNRLSLKDRNSGKLEGISLGDYLRQRRFSGRLRNHYLLPMCGAIWSTPRDQILKFPAKPFVDFLDNHGIIHPRNIPQWRTVSGGSREYVNAVAAAGLGRAKFRTGTPVAEVLRADGYTRIIDISGHCERFDRVIFACHSDQALAVLAEPTAVERSALASIAYKTSRVYLHRDRSLMPRRQKTWAAWNYLGWRNTNSELGAEMSVTYWMNRLQNIDPAYPLFVSLNPPRQPHPDLTFAQFDYSHPQYDQTMMAARDRLTSQQGQNATYYCGAYMGYGFHEDGLRSGLAIARQLGGHAPWLDVPVEAPMGKAA